MPVVDFPGGEHALGDVRLPSPADSIVRAPGGTAVLVANPADKAIFYYKEGMAAPVGSFQNYSRQPRAVLVVDRSLRERAPGTLRGRGAPPRPRAATRSPSSSTRRAPSTASRSPWRSIPPRRRRGRSREPARIESLVDAGRPLRAGEAVRLRFRLSDPRTKAPKDGLGDVTVLVYQAAASTEWREAAQAGRRRGLRDGVHPARRRHLSCGGGVPVAEPAVPSLAPGDPAGDGGEGARRALTMAPRGNAGNGGLRRDRPGVRRRRRALHLGARAAVGAARPPLPPRRAGARRHRRHRARRPPSGRPRRGGHRLRPLARDARPPGRARRRRSPRVVADFNRLEETGLAGPFDGLISTFAGLNAAPDLAGLARAATRLVRPGGVLFLHVLNPRRKGTTLAVRIAGVEVPHRLWTPRELARCFAADFAFSRLRGQGILRPVDDPRPNRGRDARGAGALGAAGRRGPAGPSTPWR